MFQSNEVVAKTPTLRFYCTGLNYIVIMPFQFVKNNLMLINLNAKAMLNYSRRDLQRSTGICQDLKPREKTLLILPQQYCCRVSF